MIYRFIIISDEVDNFMREIQIDADATFLDFHKVIQKSCGYEDGEMTSNDIDVNIDELSYRRGMRRMRDGMHHDVRYYERRPMRRSRGRYSY